MLKIYFIFSIFVTSLLSQWPVPQATDSVYLDMNPLKFTNQAKCGVESSRPTQSTYLLIDTLNIGKALYRLQSVMRLDDDFSKLGLARFRYTIHQLIETISNKLLQGELPLLSEYDHSKLKDLSQSCSDLNTCSSVHDFIEHLWNKKSLDTTSISELKTDEMKILNTPFVHFPGSNVSCFSIKDLDTLPQHLIKRKPDINDLDAIAQGVHNSKNNLSACKDNIFNDDLKLGFYQFDILLEKKSTMRAWNKLGFDFWTSLKTYLSWSWRHSELAKEMAGRYFQVFRQVSLEENLLFFSNGCRSIDKPECSQKSLNMGKLRGLAQSLDTRELSSLEYFDLNIGQNEARHFQDPLMSPGNDLLNMDQHHTSLDWAENLRRNIVRTRGFIKLKLTKSLSELHLIHHSKKESIDKDTYNFLQSHYKEEKFVKEFYSFCTELKIANSELTSFIRSDLQELKSSKLILDLTEKLKGSTKLIEESLEILNKLEPVCNDAYELGIFRSPERPLKEDFAPWYQDYVYDIKNAKEINSLYSKDESQYLTLRHEKENPFCITPMQCGRKIIEGLVRIYEFQQYAKGLVNFDNEINAPDLLNPLSEAKACGAYDPWLGTKNAIFGFFQDLTLSALSTAVPTFIYLEASIVKQKVVSLEKLLKDGKVYYNPKFDKKKVQGRLIADFGPLVGAPCALSLTSDRLALPRFLAIDGVTLQSCMGGERNTMNVFSADDINHTRRDAAACASCTISLTSAISSATLYNPALRPFFFMIRGVVRLMQAITDKETIPKSWDIDINSVYRSWRRSGNISKKCRRKLLRGKECMASHCEEKIVSHFENIFKTYVNDVTYYTSGTVKIDTHKGEFFTHIPSLGCRLKSFKKEHFWKGDH